MENVRLASGTVTPILGTKDKAVPGGQLPTYTGVTSNQVGNPHYKDSPYTSIQAVVVGTGAVAAAVTIECSNDGISWCQTPFGVITLTGSDRVSDGFTTESPWKWIRATLSGISGTGASVYVLVGV